MSVRVCVFPQMSFPESSRISLYQLSYSFAVNLSVRQGGAPECGQVRCSPPHHVQRFGATFPEAAKTEARPITGTRV